MRLLEKSARLLYREWFVNLRFPGHERCKIVDGVPEGWIPATIADIADANVKSHQAKNLPKLIKYVDISSVNKGYVQTKSEIAGSDAPGRARRIASDGDVIWSNVRPNLQAYALVLSPECNDVFSTGFTILTPKNVPYSFLYLFSTTDDFIGHLVNRATGASYPAVRADDFLCAKLSLPPQEILNDFHSIVEPRFKQKSVLERHNRLLTAARDLLLPRLMSGEVAV